MGVLLICLATFCSLFLGKSKTRCHTAPGALQFVRDRIPGRHQTVASSWKQSETQDVRQVWYSLTS